MVNMGFFERVKEKIQTINSSGNSKFVWRLSMEPGQPYHVAILNDNILDLNLHFIGMGSPMSLCNKLYENDCEECNKTNRFGNENRPSLVRCMLGYVFESVDQTRVSKSGKEYKENPVKIINIQSGKKHINFQNIDEAISGGYLNYTEESPTVWRIKRLSKNDGGGMLPPSIVSSPELRQLGQHLKLEIPNEILKEWSEISKADLFGYFLSSYSNLKKDLLEKEAGVVFPNDGTSFNFKEEDSEEGLDELETLG